MLALPFLYRNISFNWDPVPIRRILLLLRAVLQQPERISHIQHVSFMSHTQVDALDPWEPPSFQTDPNEELDQFQDVLRQAQAIVEDNDFPDPNIWLQALQNGDPYALVSIFLSQLHNLRSLKLDYTFIWQGGLPGVMLRHALFPPTQNNLSKFKNLTEVDYGGNVRRATIFDDYPEILEEEGYPLCNTDQFPPWFYLPSLRSLTIWLRTKQSLGMPDGRPDLTRLERLIVPRATINEDQVPTLLSLTPNLKILLLGLAYHYGHELSFQNGAAIVQGLESLRKTLTNLSLRVEYYPPSVNIFDLYRGERDLTAPFYGLFKEFTTLRSIEVPLQLLVGWDTKPWADLASPLPESVEKLSLRNDYEPYDENGWHEGEVLDLVGNNASRLRMGLPSLKRVVVRKWKMFWDTPEIEESREGARDACEGEGIELEVVADSFSTGLWDERRSCLEGVVS